MDKNKRKSAVEPKRYKNALSDLNNHNIAVIMLSVVLVNFTNKFFYHFSEDTRPLKDKMYDTLPKSMKTELLVKVRDEDPEIQKQRQELTRSKSPVELSQMSSISDFPVPTTFEKMLQKTRLVIFMY